jgi:hypothetical protein
MKIRSILQIAPIILLALTVSQCDDDNLQRELEELPKEIAAHLKRAPNTDLLISLPPFEVKKPGVGQVPHEDKNCSTTEHSYVQVIYPITICYPPDFSTNGLLKEFRVGSDRAKPLPPPAGETQVYKLSSFGGKAFQSPLFCIQKGGPWLASVKKEKTCIDTIEFNLTILGVPACPECPTFKWFDSLDNHPPELHLILPLSDTTISYGDCDLTDLTQCGPEVNPTPAPPPAIWLR